MNWHWMIQYAPKRHSTSARVKSMVVESLKVVGGVNYPSEAAFAQEGDFPCSTPSIFSVITPSIEIIAPLSWNKLTTF